MDVRSIMSWNVKGLGIDHKKQTIKDFIKINRCQFVLLQETHTDNNNITKTLGVTGAIWSHGNKASRGVAVAWNGNNISCEKVWKDDQGRIVIGVFKIETNTVIVGSIYAPNIDHSIRSQQKYSQFLLQAEALLEEAKRYSTEFILGGDFNIFIDPVMDTEETPSPTTHPYPICADLFNNFTTNINAIDLIRSHNRDRRLSTFSPQGENRRGTARRLDYLLCSSAMRDVLTCTTIKWGPLSDHKVVQAENPDKSDTKSGPGIWRHNDTHLNNNEYCNYMQGKIEESIANTEHLAPTRRWDMIKHDIKEASISYSKRRAREEREEIQSAELILRDEENHSLDETMTARNRIAQWNETRSKRVIFRAQADCVEQNEKCTRFFFARIAGNRAASTITKLQIDNNLENDQKTVDKEISDYYKKLYEEQPQTIRTLPFNNDLPKVTNTDNERINRPISLNEITSSLNSLPNNKSPGDDGLTPAIYRKFWTQLGPRMIESFQSGMEMGHMSTSQQRSVIRLIEKKGKDSTRIANWRPISLINVDTKIFSKCAAERLKVPLKYLIHEDQKAFIKGRQMSENITQLQASVYRIVKDRKRAALLSIDYRKAFDTVSHSAMWEILKKFGYGEYIINMIKTLYSGANSSVINNGYTTPRFRIGRSCRQGDCVSPYLFLLVIEPLLQEIRRISFDIITTKGRVKPLYAFADDCNCFFSSERTLRKILSILDTYAQFSGLTINKEKSEIMPLSEWLSEEADHNGIPIVQSIKITGTHISKNSNDDNVINFDTAIRKCEDFADANAARALSLQGKALLINAKIHGIMAHHYKHGKMNDTQIKRLDKCIFSFLWGGGDRVKRSYIRKKTKDGGLNVFDARSMNNATLIRWLSRAYADEADDLLSKEIRDAIEQIGGLLALNRKSLPRSETSNIPPFIGQFVAAFHELHQWKEEKEFVWGNPYFTSKSFSESRLARKGFLIVQNFIDSDGRTVPPREANLTPIELLEWNIIINRIRRNRRMSVEGNWPNQEENIIRVCDNEIPLEQYSIQRIKNALRDRIEGKSNGMRKLEQMLGFDVDMKVTNTIIWRQSNIPRIRAYWFKFFHCITRSNVHYAAFGIKEEEQCSFCDESPQTREHLYLHCNTVREFFREMNGNRDFMLQIRNWLQGKLCKVQAWLTAEMIYFVHAANYRGTTLSRGSFMTWLRKVRALQLYSAIQKNKVDTHARKWEEIEEELALQI